MKNRFSASKFPTGVVLNLAIIVLLVVVAYLAYSLVLRLTVAPTLDAVRDGDPKAKAIQVDVLNGCGGAKVGTQFTEYLRHRGYDVVEVRNYHRFDVRHSIIIARTTNLRNAEKVATALGIAAPHIIQQINPDYFVDVSVLIGHDYQSLKPSQ
jgi:hypothetical protein